MRFFCKAAICLILVFNSCSSGTRALEQGNYDEAVNKAVERLRSNPGHRKASATLKKAFIFSKNWHLGRITDLENTTDPFKYEKIASEYRILNDQYDQVQRCPGCISVLDKPKKYISEYDNARSKAAEVRYDLGLQSLEGGISGNREDAKEGYFHFSRANVLWPGFKEVVNKMNEAEYHATLRVLLEPVPMQVEALRISSEFFRNKIQEFLNTNPVNRFVRFYTPEEAEQTGIEADQIVRLAFDDFVVGQTYIREQEIQAERDSVVLGFYEIEADPAIGTISRGDALITICHLPESTRQKQTLRVKESELSAHLEHGDFVGSCEAGPVSEGTVKRGKVKREIYGTVKAKLHLITETLESKGVLDLKIMDAYSGSVISQEKLPGIYIWQNEYGYFNGDERALTEQQLVSTKNRRLLPPPPQELFVAFTQPIYSQILAKMKDFYRNY